MFQLEYDPIGGVDGGGGKQALGYWNVVVDDGTTHVWTNTNSEYNSAKQIRNIEAYYSAKGASIRQMKFVDGGYTIWETPREAKFYRVRISSKDPNKFKNNLIIAAENYDAALTASSAFGVTKTISDSPMIFMGSIK